MSTPEFGRGGARRRRENVLGAISSAVFSLAIGILNVAFPVLAVNAGYAAAAVGALVALSAVSQLLMRLGMGALMRRVPDKWFVVASGLLIAVACLMFAASAHLVALVIAQLVHGAARAFFWTGIQTHVVREEGSAVRGLTAVNSASVIGSVVGPALAGWLSDGSVRPALLVAAAVGGMTVLVAMLLRSLPPFPPKATGSQIGERLFQRRGFVIGSLAAASAGVWRGVLTSYVPVILTEAGHALGTVGLLVSAANGAVFAGSSASVRLARLGSRRIILLSLLFAGIGTGFFGLLAGHTLTALLGLAVSGLGAGLLQTLGASTAVDGVLPEDKGDAVATTGTFRAAGMFVAPLGMAGAVLVLPMGAAFAAAGVVILLMVPFGWADGRRR